MRRLLGWILLVLGVLGLGWWGSTRNAPSIEAQVAENANLIQSDLATLFNEANVSTKVSGRDITLSGTVSEVDKDEILGKYDDVVGRRVVRDNLTAMTVVSPYRLDAVKTENGVSIVGHANSWSGIETISGVIEGVNADELTLAAGAPEGWTDIATTALGALNALETGKLAILDNNVTLSGHGSNSAAREAAEVALAALPASMAKMSDITTPIVGPDFTADFDMSKGLTLNGMTTSDGASDVVVKTLGNLPVADANLTDGQEGSFDQVRERLAAIAPMIPSFDRATITARGDEVTFEGELGAGFDQTVLQGNLDGALGAENVTIAANSSQDGDNRFNVLVGENEVFGRGFWLPAFDFDATQSECAKATDGILSSGRIEFLSGSADLDGSANNIINRIAGTLKHCLAGGSLALELGGHTDASGDDDANLALSQARAEAVRDAIATRGIDVTDVTAKGYGETQPIADNETDEGKAKNRRTTIIWVQK